MFCPNCGKENNDSAKFCKHCGQSIQQSATKTFEETSADYIWGYRFKHGTGLDLKSIQEAIEKKSDYKIIDHGAIKNDVFVYQKGRGKNSGLIVFTKKDDEVLILGNDKGLISARSRFINRKFKKPYKEKVLFGDMGKPLLQAVKEYSVPQGSEKDSISGISGWLAFFILGVFLSSLVPLAEAFSVEFGIVAIIDILLAGFAIYTGILLVRIKPRAVLFAKILLSVYLILNILTLFAGTGPDDPTMITATRGVIFDLIWLAYLFVSTRVKATYSS